VELHELTNMLHVRGKVANNLVMICFSYSMLTASYLKKRRRYGKHKLHNVIAKSERSLAPWLLCPLSCYIFQFVGKNHLKSSKVGYSYGSPLK